MSHATFSIVKQDAASITIRDDFYEGRPTLSVTNDAEWVVRFLFQAGDLGDRKLFYYDTAGDLDEIQHNGAVFTGFAPGPGRRL